MAGRRKKKLPSNRHIIRAVQHALNAAADGDTRRLYALLTGIGSRWGYDGLFAATMCAAQVAVSHDCPDGHHWAVVAHNGETSIDDLEPCVRTAVRIVVAHEGDDRPTVAALWKAAADAGPDEALAVAGLAMKIAAAPHGQQP